MALLISGKFSSINNPTYESFAQWNGTALSKPYSGNLSSVDPNKNRIRGVVKNSSGHFYLIIDNVGLVKYNGSSWSVAHSYSSYFLQDIAIDGSDNVYYCSDYSIWKCTSGGTVTEIGFADDGGAPGNSYDSTVTVDSGGNVYYGTSFASISPYVGGPVTTAANIAKWNGSAWSAMAAGCAEPVVKARANGTTIWVGTYEPITPVGRLRSWNGSAWTTHNTQNHTFIAFGFYGTDVYTMQGYHTFGATPKKWNGSTLTSVGSQTMTAHDLCVVGSYLYVSCDWLYRYGAGGDRGAENIGCQSLGFWGWGVVKYNLASGSEFTALTADDPAGLPSVHTLYGSGSTLYLCGGFDFSYSGATTGIRNIAAYDSGLAKFLGASTGGYNNPVIAKTSGTKILVGAPYDNPLDTVYTTGGTPTSIPSGIAMWDGSTWTEVTTDAPAGIYHIASNATSFVVCGSFETSIGGATAQYIARYDGTTWSGLGSAPDGNIHRVYIDSSGDIYASGEFATIGGVSANRIARWNGTTWNALGTGLSGGSSVNCYAITGDGAGNIYAGGNFTSAGGVSVNRIAKWNGSTWSALGTGTNGVNNNVNALCYRSGTLYVGGSFGSAGGVSGRDKVAKYTTGTNTWSTWGGSGDFGGTPLGCSAITAHNGQIYIGFDSYGAPKYGLPYPEALYRWTGSTWQGLGSSYGLNPYESISLLEGEEDVDTTPPTPGNSGTITTSNIQSTSITLNWTKATDDTSAQNTLQYLAYYSLSSTMDSVSDVETNGTPSGSYTTDINTKAVGSLSSSTPYYFNVIVKDEAGNKAAYTKKQETTLDVTPPTPGNSGTITTSNIQSSSITLNWTKATDDITSQANLLYLAYYSLSSVMDSVANIEANGTAFGSYTVDINTKQITGLASNKPYYFNVIVKDEAGNKAAYAKKQETTPVRFRIFVIDSDSGKTRAVAYPGFYDYVESVTGSSKTIFQLDVPIDADHKIDVFVDGRNQAIEGTHWTRNTGLGQIITTSAVSIGSDFKARVYLK